jgi:hypothetical protein
MVLKQDDQFHFHLNHILLKYDQHLRIQIQEKKIFQIKNSFYQLLLKSVVDHQVLNQKIKLE